MIFDFFLFFISLSALGFSFSGYLLCLALIKLLKKSSSIDNLFTKDSHLPQKTIHVIVPTFNEAPYIVQKINNLVAQDHPAKKIWITDGGSSDETIDLVKKEFISKKLNNIELLNSSRRGKINQLNEVLEKIGSDSLVVVSDADAICLTFDALTKAAIALEINQEIGLIGGWTNPENHSALQTELAFWDKQNRARHLETIAFSSSIVVAPFYAFRRDLIEKFPEDCVADDVYISYASHLKHLRIIYTPEIPILERRTPANRRDFFLHKFRKAHAYTTELFRVLHRLPYMGKRLKFYYLTKLFQFFYLPWFFLFLFIESFILASSGYATIVLFFYIIFFMLILLASAVMKPPKGMKRGGISLVSFFSSLETFLALNLVLISNSILFAFWRQDSNYPRLRENK
jgi:cellulose synthase/poly-beta-1,6-N-acetylglucosamine synthase-like glycosyltransferase